MKIEEIRKAADHYSAALTSIAALEEKTARLFDRAYSAHHCGDFDRHKSSAEALRKKVQQLITDTKAERDETLRAANVLLTELESANERDVSALEECNDCIVLLNLVLR